MVGGEENDLNDASFSNNKGTPRRDVVAVSSSSSSLSSSSSENELRKTRNENDQSQCNDNASRELVLYNPPAGDGGANEPVSPPIEHRRPSILGQFTPKSSRVMLSVGAFTIQCAGCFKWRLIPTKEKYEEIREHLLEQPFYCENAREWRPDISCDDPAEITQDGSRLWAIDKPNIARPPLGWQRQLHIRGIILHRQARMVDIQKYLSEHPDYQTEGISMRRFSFQIPKPLQENYVRKRRAHINASCDGSKLESGGVNPISCDPPDGSTALQLGRPGLPELLSAALVNNHVVRPAKKVKRALAKEMEISSLELLELPSLKLDQYEK